MDSLNADQIRQIRAAVTWGDQYEARKQGTDDAQDMAALAMHRAAKRIAVIPADTSLEDFLDAVPVEVMSEALDEERNPTSPSTAT